MLVWICMRYRGTPFKLTFSSSWIGGLRFNFRMLRTWTWVQRSAWFLLRKMTSSVSYPQYDSQDRIAWPPRRAELSAFNWLRTWVHQHDLFMSPTYTPPPSTSYPIHSSQTPSNLSSSIFTEKVENPNKVRQKDLFDLIKDNHSSWNWRGHSIGFSPHWDRGGHQKAVGGREEWINERVEEEMAREAGRHVVTT